MHPPSRSPDKRNTIPRTAMAGLYSASRNSCSSSAPGGDRLRILADRSLADRILADRRFANRSGGGGGGVSGRGERSGGRRRLFARQVSGGGSAQHRDRCRSNGQDLQHGSSPCVSSIS